MSKKLTPEVINRIRSLRKEGYSLSEIYRQVKAGYGTIYRYIQGVQISSKHQNWWRGKRGGSKKRKEIAEYKASQKAKEVVSELSIKEKALFIVALYWGEGTKADFGLSNTDPELIRVFVKGLIEVFHIQRTSLRISIRIYEDLDYKKALKFWSKITGVSIHKLISVNVLKGKKKGKAPYGMCRVRISKGGDMLKYVHALKKEVIQLF